MCVPLILGRLGYRNVLAINTMMMGGLIMLFSTVGLETPVWMILAQAFMFGFCSSLQYSSMNTLVYADIADADASKASTIASTTQQMSMSFGVATASLTAAFFIPDRFHSQAPELIHGIHQAFVAVGGLTLLSTLVFVGLRRTDGAVVSHQNAPLA